ncbi:MFS transporter [Picrophilus oshimae]|uniref:Predicted arabinose efflux permease, MFS family n=1 Tax=Picrophilus torridus (strain ATCC 700027 / DSM 9790 / JCM 10055 / NBRC 100828 / KAW 2/3) TaxID=1122961 RepID=Q6KZI9_PICTO|nr:MFS transporter [Picrophilus oshimae]AAT43863.1 transporter [Picrophilus oshimae DSM 9789]SMD31068.1 Predicted arabinose efflux permease, MFS family [Picrophilus oshimae DSM 9789]
MNKYNNIIYVIFITILMTFSMRSVNNMIVTTLPLLSNKVLYFSSVLVGIISASVYLFTFIVTSMVNPRLNSKQRRTSFIIANLAVVIVLIMYYYANDISVWIASAIAGLAYGIIMPNMINAASLMADQKSRERLLAVYSVGLSLSLIIGPSLEDYLLTFIGYRLIFIYFLPIAITGLFISMLMKFPEIKNENHKSAIRSKGLKAGILTITTYNVPFAAITVFLTIFAISHFHISRSLAYSSYIYFFSVSFMTRLYMSIRPFKNIRLPLIISILITVSALILFPFVPAFAFFVVIMMALGIPHGSIFPISTIIISRGTTPEERSAANSYFMAFNNILFMLIPVFFGFIEDYIGYSMTFLVLVVPVILSTILLFKEYGNNSIMVAKPKAM